MIYTKMSTLSPVYAKSRHVYIMAQDFHLFSAMPKSVLFEICTLLFLYISLLEIATIFSSKNFYNISLLKYFRRLPLPFRDDKFISYTSYCLNTLKL